MVRTVPFYFAPIGLLIFVLIAFGVVFAIVALLSHERTRTFAKAVLAVLGLMLGLGLLASLLVLPYVALRRQQAQSAIVVERQHMEVARHRAEEMARRHLDEAARIEASDARPAGRVTGTVRYDGEPIAEGTISFLPIQGTEGPKTTAKITDGQFAMPRVPAGTYRVAIRATRPADQTVRGPGGNEIPAEVQYLPPKYNVASRLQASVRPGDNTFDFQLQADSEEEVPAPKSADAVAVAEGHEPEDSEAGKPTDPSEGQPPAPEPPSPETTAKQELTPPEDRPAWVDWDAGTLHKVGSACQMAITVGPYSSRAECDQKLPDELHTAIRKYVAARLGQIPSAHVRLPLDYIRRHVRAEWEEPKRVLITPRGQIPEKYVPMTQLHVLLEFDHEVNTLIEQEWDKVAARERIAVAGVATGVVLLLLGLVYAYLKIDLSTGGRYRGRLRLTAAALLALMVAAGLALMLNAWRMRPPHVDVEHIQPGTATPIEPAGSAVGPAEVPHSSVWIEYESGPRAAATPSETVWGAPEPHSSGQSVGRPAIGVAVIVLPGALVLLGGIATLIAFKKTRLIGLVVLPAALLAMMVAAGVALMLNAWRMRPPHVDVEHIQPGTATPIEPAGGAVAPAEVPHSSVGIEYETGPPAPATPSETVWGAPEPHSSGQSVGRPTMAVVVLPGALVLLGGIATLIAFKKTRLIGLVVLAVVILGALILVA